MRIGIDASRAFLKNRTGIEEYSYQVIKHLKDQIKDHEVVLYIRKDQRSKIKDQNDNSNGKNDQMEIPTNWQVKIIRWPRFWTQIGLSLEMLFHPVDALFVPAHTVPFIHPRNTIVTVHGLEYEFCSKAYSFWERIYMRWSIRNSCRWARKIISVSENTKKDLINLYKVFEEKIEVIYEGYSKNFEFRISNFESNQNDEFSKIKSLEIQSKLKIQNSKFILFVGRIEERKNILNIIQAFEILKEKYHFEHKLVLAGKPGYGYDDIKHKILNTKYKKDILELGYVSDEDKFELLKNATVFVFPTLYEGFGIPVLEAQSMGCPVVAANNSSIPEVAGDSALLVDENNPDEIINAIQSLLSNESLKNDIIKKGLENVKKFSWEKSAEQIAGVLVK